MKTMQRFSVQPLLPRFFFQPVFWVWATILLSILVTGSVSWLRFRQQQVVLLATTKLESIRLARIDLSKGFLYTTLPQSPDSPFNQDQGLTLLQQGITTLDQTLIDLGPEALELAGSFRASVKTFQNTLTDWNMAPIPLPGQTTKLRIAFFDLESQADLVDMQTQQSLNRLSVRLDTEFIVALAISAFMLAGICGIVFLSNRARRDSEDAQRESEERFRAIIENSAAGYFRIGVDERFQYVNNAWLKMHGYSSADEIIGKHFSVTHVEADLERSKRVVESTLIGESIPPDEFTRRCKDGTTGYHTFSVNPVRQGGKIIGLEGFLVDITERKHAEEALRLSEERFKAIASNTPDHILIQDLLLKYTFVINPQLGLTEKDMVGKTDYDFLPKEEADQLTQIKTQVLESGKPKHFETSLISKSGKPEYFDGIYMPKFNVGGRVDGLIGYFRNVTERVQAEKTLQESEARLVQAQAIAHVGNWELDLANKTMWVSAEASRIYGLERSAPILPLELIQRVPLAVERPRLDAALATLLEKRGQYDEEFRIERVNDHVRRFVHSIAHLECDANDQPVKVIGVIQDITERKQAEEVLQSREEILRLFIEHTPASIAMFDREMKYLANSHRFLADYHLGDQVLIGRSHYEVFPDIPERWKEIHNHCLAGAIEKCEKDSFPRADGSIDWVHWEIYPWKDNEGKIGGIIMFTEVITERVKAEEKVTEQMKELRRWYDATLGRETRVLELKTEVNKLLGEAGLPHRYPSTGSETP